jgi:hypothetical protein
MFLYLKIQNTDLYERAISKDEKGPSKRMGPVLREDKSLRTTRNKNHQDNFL